MDVLQRHTASAHRQSGMGKATRIKIAPNSVITMGRGQSPPHGIHRKGNSMNCVLYLKNCPDTYERVRAMSAYADSQGWKILNTIVELGEVTTAAAMAFGNADVVLFHDAESMVDGNMNTLFEFLLGLHANHTRWHFLNTPEMSEIVNPDFWKTISFILRHAKTDSTTRIIPPDTHKESLHDDVLALRKAGKTYKEIASSLGISTSRAHQISTTGK